MVYFIFHFLFFRSLETGVVETKNGIHILSNPLTNPNPRAGEFEARVITRLVLVLAPPTLDKGLSFAGRYFHPVK